MVEHVSPWAKDFKCKYDICGYIDLYMIYYSNFFQIDKFPRKISLISKAYLLLPRSRNGNANAVN